MGLLAPAERQLYISTRIFALSSLHAPLVRQVEHPGTVLQAWLPQQSVNSMQILEFRYSEPWESSPQVLWLVACKEADGTEAFSVMLASVSALEAARGTAASAQGIFLDLLRRMKAPRMVLGTPLRLRPIFIPKPWGQEIWYTGIEQRGVSEVGDGQYWLPLSWLLAALPSHYGKAPPVLLKILDPLPDEVFGDLYFELHQEKREVYVVTSIDRTAWPDGVGAIRYGFNPAIRAEFDNDQAFRSAYLKAVAAYRTVRVSIDRRLDACRAEQGLAAEAPVPATQLRSWLATLPAELLEQEHRLRRDMEKFTQLRPLQVGDVVQVPLLTPHSLQHGVRTIEFQTPVYERLILSFGQKVLTQQHWDTEQAAALMRLDTPPDALLPELRSGNGWREQEIVDFPDFEARRLRFSGAGKCLLPVLSRGGAAMAVGKPLSLGPLTLEPEQAALLPCHTSLQVSAREPASLLWAQPRG